MVLIVEIIQSGMRLNQDTIGKIMLRQVVKGFEKFKSDVRSHASIAKQNGASFQVHSNTPIPQHIKDWLTSKNISFKEY